MRSESSRLNKGYQMLHDSDDSIDYNEGVSKLVSGGVPLGNIPGMHIGINSALADIEEARIVAQENAFIRRKESGKQVYKEIKSISQDRLRRTGVFGSVLSDKYKKAN